MKKKGNKVESNNIYIYLSLSIYLSIELYISLYIYIYIYIYIYTPPHTKQCIP